MSRAAARRPPPKEAPRRSAAPAVSRLAFTVDATSWKLERVEAVEGDGVRRELSRDERGALAGDDLEPSLEAIVEQAFMAGIDYLLGDGEDADTLSEAEQALLRPLIAHSPARRLMAPQVLRRAALADLLRQAVPARAKGVKAA